MNRTSSALFLLALTVAGSAYAGDDAGSFTMPFDFSRSSIGLTVTIHNEPLYVILDTGVNPSVIDLHRAEALGLKIERQNSGEPSGFGDQKGEAIFPTSIQGLAIDGHAFGPFDALASDMSALSTHYGRILDGVLGYSFLQDKIVLIDYEKRSLGVLAFSSDAARAVGTCRTKWTVPLRTVESYPVIPGFRLGEAQGPLTLDTGSNGGIALYQAALSLKGLRPALTEKSVVTLEGARGESNATAYTLSAPVGFGPFMLPAGSTVTLRKEQGSTHTRVANGGNALFAALRVKMLLDYRHRSMSFYGDCS